LFKRCNAYDRDFDRHQRYNGLHTYLTTQNKQTELGGTVVDRRQFL